MNLGIFAFNISSYQKCVVSSSFYPYSHELWTTIRGPTCYVLKVQVQMTLNYLKEIIKWNS